MTLELINGSLTDSERFNILESLSDEILIESIKDQIMSNKFELFEKESLIDIFEKRYSNVLNYYKDDVSMTQELDELRTKFFLEIEKSLYNRFGISINEDLSERYLILKSLYNHLVLNNKDSYVNFFLDFINKNKDSITTSIEATKSIESFVMKKQNMDKDIITILTNLHPIVNYIMDVELDNIDVFEATLEDGEVDSFIIKSNISKLTLDNSFRDKFIDVIKGNNHNYFITVTSLHQALLDALQ